MNTLTIYNRAASYNYFLEDSFEAGIVLVGSEIKSIREGHAQLVDAYGYIRDGEAFLLNAYISPYSNASYNNHEPTRTRKLLLHKHEIEKISKNITRKGYTLIPTQMYFKNGRVKVQLFLGKGKNAPDKRAVEKEKDIKREIQTQGKGDKWKEY